MMVQVVEEEPINKRVQVLVVQVLQNLIPYRHRFNLVKVSHFSPQRFNTTPPPFIQINLGNHE